jgi:hypothetical protein
VGGIFGNGCWKLKKGQIAYGTITSGSPSGNTGLFMEEGADIWMGIRKAQWNPHATPPLDSPPPEKAEESLSYLTTIKQEKDGLKTFQDRKTIWLVLFVFLGNPFSIFKHQIVPSRYL